MNKTITLRIAAAVALLASSLVQAQTQAWPTKPVRLVVPVSPGGTTDLLARVLGEALQKSTGQAFVVDGKPGAAGALGSIEVARAPADGYTLLVATSSTHAVAPAMSNTLRYDPVGDFTPIALLAEANNLLLVSPSVPAKNMTELLQTIRSKPGQLNYVSSGIGSFGHLIFELFKLESNTFITHIPYKGTGATIPDLVSGQVHLAVDAIPSGLPHVKDGRVKALAVTGPRRSALAPEIPTIAESGLPRFAVLSWFGLYAPKALAPDLQKRINAEVVKVLNTPEMTARFANLGIEPGRGSPADFAAMVAADRARWTDLVKQRNIKAD
jgi:tripartite-type tricarboxylate transporter receptor subunit TctC